MYSVKKQALSPHQMRAGGGSSEKQMIRRADHGMAAVNELPSFILRESPVHLCATLVIQALLPIYISQICSSGRALFWWNVIYC